LHCRQLKISIGLYPLSDGFNCLHFLSYRSANRTIPALKCHNFMLADLYLYRNNIIFTR